MNFRVGVVTDRSGGDVLEVVSIVIPAYNEAGRISATIKETHAYFESIGQPLELIVVDDGSHDETVARARQVSALLDGVEVIAAPHRGKAGAVLTGMRNASGTIVGFTDVDLATPLDTWIMCRDILRQRPGVAIASREEPGSVRVGEPWYRHAMGRTFNAFVRTLLLPGLRDTQCGFKMFSRATIEVILDRVRLYDEDDVVSRARVTAFDVELLYIARRHGFPITSVPVRWSYGEQSKVHPVTDTLQNIRDIVLVRINGWRGYYS